MTKRSNHIPMLMRIDTTNITPQEAAQEILLYLEKQGYLGGPAESN